LTAINALSTPQAAYMIADSAAYWDDGEIGGFESKVLTLPHLRMALATSGKLEQRWRVAKGLLKMASFDDVIEQAPARLRELWDEGEFHDYRDQDEDAAFRLIVAGLSERTGQGAVYALATDEQPGQTPFTFALAPIAITPSVHPDRLRKAKLIDDNNIAGGSPPEDWLTRLIDLQRELVHLPAGEVARAEDVAEDEGQRTIGGHAVLTRIDANGITQTVVRRWNDSIGEKIDLSRPVEMRALARMIAR
jgi:hypothetical protein